MMVELPPSFINKELVFILLTLGKVSPARKTVTVISHCCSPIVCLYIWLPSSSTKEWPWPRSTSTLFWPYLSFVVIFLLSHRGGGRVVAVVVDGFCLVEDCDASVDLILHSAFVCTAVHSCFDGRVWVEVDVHGCMGRLTSPTRIKSFNRGSCS